MTGYDILKKSCALLGYDTIPDDNHLSDRMAEIIQSVALDLKTDIPENFSEEFTVPPEKREAFIYGCTMMLAVTLSDASLISFYADLYASKRGCALNHTETREDVLPSTLGEGI